jgi:RimJ/RimL family protein N-acetyltransferase
MFARTDRLLLRPGWAEDAPALLAAIADEGIVRNLASVPWPYSRTDAEAFLTAERPVETPSFLLFRRTHGAPQLVGTAGLARTPEGAIELGYWISRPYWGLGYATEAAGAVVDIARDTLRHGALVAGHFLDNPASGRVLQKIGFAPTGAVDERFSIARGEKAPCKLFERVLRDASASPAASFEKAFCMAA